MSSLANVFGIASTALNAQTVRMNLTASNLANAGSTASTEDKAYKARMPVFQAILQKEVANAGAPYLGGVKVQKIVSSTQPNTKVFDPNHPDADAEGFLYKSNVSEVQEMVEMMAAARSFQNNVEVVNTARDLSVRTLDILKA